MKKIILGSAVFLFAIGCNEQNKADDQDKMSADPSAATTTVPSKDDEMKALYEKNLAILQSNISAFEKEDINAMATTIADDARYQPPMYGAKETTKEEWVKMMSGYMAEWDSLKLVNPNFLPGVDTTSLQFDGSVRYYGNWTGVHKSGVKANINFYGSYDFNKDGKISSGSEFFDFGGMMNAVKGKK